jgi:hypothetical protein
MKRPACAKSSANDTVRLTRPIRRGAFVAPLRGVDASFRAERGMGCALLFRDERAWRDWRSSSRCVREMSLPVPRDACRGCRRSTSHGLGWTSAWPSRPVPRSRWCAPRRAPVRPRCWPVPCRPRPPPAPAGSAPRRSPGCASTSVTTTRAVSSPSSSRRSVPSSAATVRPTRRSRCSTASTTCWASWPRATAWPAPSSSTTSTPCRRRPPSRCWVTWSTTSRPSSTWCWPAGPTRPSASRTCASPVASPRSAAPTSPSSWAR